MIHFLCKLPSIWLLHWSPKLRQVLKWPGWGVPHLWMEVPWWAAAFRSLKAILQRELHLLPLSLEPRLLFHGGLMWLRSQAAKRAGHTWALFELSSTNLLLTNLVIGPLHCLLWIQDPQVSQTILHEITRTESSSWQRITHLQGARGWWKSEEEDSSQPYFWLSSA